jgi:tRNA(His) 5'-end guanylyltransferase
MALGEGTCMACQIPRRVVPILQGTQTEQKNELLFSQFGINYAKLPERFKKVSGAARR